MPSAVLMKAIISTKLTTHTFNAYMLNALKRAGKEMEKDFNKTIATWQTHHPEFKVKVRYAGGAASVEVWTEDEIYFYLDNGTPVRYATMTSDFVPKTKPGWIGSGPGAGGVRYINKKYPRRGIEAREFSKMVEQDVYDKFVQYVDDAVAKAFASAKGGMR